MRPYLDTGHAGPAAISGCGSIIWWIGSKLITLHILGDCCVETKSLAWSGAGDTEFLYSRASDCGHFS